MATILRYSPNTLSFPPRVYPDTNFLISFYIPNHQWFKNATTLLAELTIQKVEIVLSLLTIDEALYQLLKLKYEDQNGKGSWIKNQPLKTDTQVCARLHSELDLFIKSLWKIPNISLLDQARKSFDIVDDVLRNIASYSLGPRDAFHLSILMAEGLDMILTNDNDFDRVLNPAIQVVHFA